MSADLESSFVYTGWTVWSSKNATRKRILLHVPTTSSVWQGHTLRHSTQRNRSGNRSPAERKRRAEVAVARTWPIEGVEIWSRNTLHGPTGHVWTNTCRQSVVILVECAAGEGDEDNSERSKVIDLGVCLSYVSRRCPPESQRRLGDCYYNQIDIF